MQIYGVKICGIFVCLKTINQFHMSFSYSSVNFKGSTLFIYLKIFYLVILTAPSI